MKTATKPRHSASLDAAPANGIEPCCHHWLLGQPIAGHVPAVCRKCGVSRDYPAVLDDLDPPAEPDKALGGPNGEANAAAHDEGDVTTAAGGARPSSVTSITQKPA
jgi:hypothetical protein